MKPVSFNLAHIRQKIAAAAKAAGRDPAYIKLIAVSKTRPVEDIRAALAAGQTCFGENRVQEAKAKFTTLRKEYAANDRMNDLAASTVCPPPLEGGVRGGVPKSHFFAGNLCTTHPSSLQRQGASSSPHQSVIELHLIGPLQTNKVTEAVRLFDVIQTLDRPKLAAALAAAMKKENRRPRLYVEVNIGNEPQKAGIAPEALSAFLKQCRGDYGLTIEGLMCIPPESEDPEPHFRHLKQLADQHALPHISMGMSADFEKAIRCGATEVRLGTAVFEERL